jgi:CBS domain containing-hemolysin-like protein
MERIYHALASHSLPPGTMFQQPLLPEPRRVTPEDSAVDVMTDFRRVRAITVPATVSIDYAAERMRANRVHLLLVVDERNVVGGLITSTDLESEKPLIVMQRLRMRREGVTVANIMTPCERIEVIEMADVVRARVGHVVATLKAVGRQHAMVIDHDDSGRPIVRGLFAVSQLNRQLLESFQPTEIARSFAEVETALAHH